MTRKERVQKEFLELAEYSKDLETSFLAIGDDCGPEDLKRCPRTNDPVFDLLNQEEEEM